MWQSHGHAAWVHLEQLVFHINQAAGTVHRPQARTETEEKAGFCYFGHWGKVNQPSQALVSKGAPAPAALGPCLGPAALGPNANASLSVHVVSKAAGLHGLSTVPDAAPLGRDTCWTGSWLLGVLGVEAGKTTSLRAPVSSSKEMWCSPAGYPIRSDSP